MDHIKEAFSKVKDDFLLLKRELDDLKKQLSEIQVSILNLNKTLYRVSLDRQTDTSTHSSTQPLNYATKLSKNTTDIENTTDNTTHNYHFKAFKGQKDHFSIGNNGVSTDRQTDRQTDTHIIFPLKTSEKPQINTSLLLSQLDNVKKDLRLKIKKLTKQEMTVYSAIYQFEDQGHIVDYSLLSTSLGLSESSIRDYIQRISNKGMPLFKEKISNKKVILKIPEDLRKLATLDTLLKLRNL